MLEQSKQNGALAALHLVLCHTRAMALLEEDNRRIAGILDWAELLPQYLAAEEDKAVEFEHALECIAEIDPQLHIALDAFSNRQTVKH